MAARETAYRRVFARNPDGGALVEVVVETWEAWEAWEEEEDEEEDAALEAESETEEEACRTPTVVVVPLERGFESNR